MASRLKLDLQGRRGLTDVVIGEFEDATGRGERLSARRSVLCDADLHEPPDVLGAEALVLAPDGDVSAGAALAALEAEPPGPARREHLAAGPDVLFARHVAGPTAPDLRASSPIADGVLQALERG